MTTEATARARPVTGTRAPAQSAEQPPVARLAPSPLPARRNPTWIALGIVALCLGALLSYVIYARVADQRTVVAVARTVHRGDTIQAADLATVSLAPASGIDVVPAAQLDQLVGQQAAYDLVAGSLLPVGSIARALEPGHGRAVVGIRLVSGRAPAGPLPHGSPLRLVALPPSGSNASAPDPYAGRTIFARTVSEIDGADGTSVLVNVDVAAALAPSVALLAAQERLAVVRDADR